ncbi:hypothetical protein WA1_07180 [Scytonema hofmannii PCC 7110]|uniref:Uncharacterized protein n=1 Tax=Scytonema hofmannii PCC 7110 TaxID=128403 RepID=A0A139WT37_9CYAN|nr:hypothetical protein [Scytonema hofmannii]KYC35598.1 hypothetical protein WA1_07180 [Scytonema hofmannii PCC 7110]
MKLQSQWLFETPFQLTVDNSILSSPNLENEHEWLLFKEPFTSEKAHLIEFEGMTLSSCEPRKFKRDRLNVVKWWKRTTPGKREIPKDKKLAILSRGRIRLPFENIRWLLEQGKKRNIEWIKKLPDNIAMLSPEVDVTVELWMAIKGRVTSAEDEKIFSEWNKDRLQELTSCGYMLGRSYKANQKKLVESKLNLGSLGLNLDKLYKAGGVNFSGLPASKDAPFIEVFLLYVYITFPTTLKKFLKLSTKPPTKEEQRKLLVKKLLKVSSKIPTFDPDPIRRERVLCILRKLTSAIVDGEKIDDIFCRFPGQAGRPLCTHFIDELIESYLYEKDDKKLWYGINTLYQEMIEPMNHFNRQLQSQLIEPGPYDPKKIVSKSEECKQILYFLKKAKDKRSIYSCLRSWILKTFEICDV